MPRTTLRVRQTDFTRVDGVVAATQSNITDLGAGAPDTVDGIGLAVGDRILVKAQSSGAENGIYVVDTVGTGVNGAWSRAKDMQAGTDRQGGIVVLVEGTGATTDVLVWYALTSPGINANLDVGTTVQVWTKTTDSGFTAGNFNHEVPTGAIDGANTSFSITNTPLSGTLMLFLNGILLEEGAGDDYTLSGTTITMLDAPKGAPGNPDKLFAFYID